MIPAALTALATLVMLSGFARPPTRRLARTPSQRSLPSRRVWVGPAALVVLVLGGPYLLAVTAVVAVSTPRVRRVLEQREHRRRVEREFPDAIEMLVLVVRAGMTPHQAVSILASRAPGAIRPAFDAVRRRTSHGEPLAEALGALREHLGDTASLIVDPLAMAERHGSPLGDALDQLANDVHERRRRVAEADARTLPIRMSFPLVTCTLPSFVLLAIVPAVLAALGSLDIGDL